MGITVTTGGEPLHGQQLAPGPVELLVRTNYRATALAIHLDGQPVPTTWATSGTTAAVGLDLTGVPAGGHALTVQVTTRGTSSLDIPVDVLPSQPGASNTGVPEGTTLTPSGSVTVRTAGMVLDGLDIAGSLRIEADDVTVRRCRISSSGTVISGQGKRTLLEDVEVDGLGRAGMGIMLNHVTLRRVDVHGSNDGVRLTSRSLLVDSWVHHLVRQGALHPDCVQTTGGTGSRVEHCTLDAWNPDSGEMGNAAVMIGGELAPLVDFTVEDCWLDGGNGTVMMRSDAVPGPVTLTDNRYGPHHRYAELMHGHIAPTYSGTAADGRAVRARLL